MRRRRLRLHVSSDDDDDEVVQQQHQSHQQRIQEEVAGSTETLTSPNPNPTHPPPSGPLPVEISDDDYLDVEEELAPSSPPAPISNGIPSQSSTTANSDHPIGQFLQNLGVKVRREWLDSCISVLSNSVPGFSSLNVDGKAELCFKHFLFSDMNFSGAGVLPNNVHALHLVDLPGPFVLQVDEIVNISCPLKDRYRENTSAGIKRCLKLSMTDGVQRIVGMEYRPIKALQVLAPAGFKVAVHNIHIRRGLLMLVPEVLDILGGSVDDLEDARQRLVAEVNKPPRGKRTRTGSVPSLDSRATLAAWSPNDTNDQVPTNMSTSHPTSSFGISGQGASFHTDAADTRGRSLENHFVPNDRVNTEINPSLNQVMGTRGRSSENYFVRNDRSNAEPNQPLNRVMDTRGRTENDTFHTAAFDRRGRTAGECSLAIDRSNADPNTLSDPVMDLEDTNMVDANIHFQASGTAGSDTSGRISEDLIAPNARAVVDLPDTSMSDASMSIEENDRESVAKAFGTTGVREGIAGDVFVSAETNISSNPVLDDEETNMNASLDVGDTDMVDEIEHLSILNGYQEIPFTYLACLIAKWTAKEDEVTPSVQGKIKCFMTGVKKFDFKQRSTYDLRVYVDDGSFISEILIHHNVVQKLVGHSPKEATTALASPDDSPRMKDIMRKFQFFLINFEGIMVIEINKTSPLPVALDMKQGCSSSDTRLLLRRLKMSTCPQTPRHKNVQPVHSIDISP